jgi:hypothetical protein
MNRNPRLKLLRIAVGLTTRKAESMMKCVRRSKEGKLAGKTCKRFSNFHVLGDPELLFTTCPDAVLMCSYGHSVYKFGLCLVEFCWGAI